MFVDERGQRINGQWTGSPSPVEHDIMTGSKADGTLRAGLTCADWTSASETACGASRSLRRPRARTEYRRRAVVVELGARQPELRQHGAAWRRRTHLLLRPIENQSRRVLRAARVRRNHWLADALSTRKRERDQFRVQSAANGHDDVLLAAVRIGHRRCRRAGRQFELPHQLARRLVERAELRRLRRQRSSARDRRP